MNEERQAILIKEKKKKIDKIRKKYKNLEMDEETAEKISRLEVVNKTLKAATTAVGIITVIDIIVPDGLPILDEALFAGATALLKHSSTLVENKINDLATKGSTEIDKEEVYTLVNDLYGIINRKKEEENTISR